MPILCIFKNIHPQFSIFKSEHIHLFNINSFNHRALNCGYSNCKAGFNFTLSSILFLTILYTRLQVFEKNDPSGSPKVALYPVAQKKQNDCHCKQNQDKKRTRNSIHKITC